MVSAELKYRNRVPGDWFALERSHIDFHGNEEIVNSLSKLSRLIEFEKAKAVNLKIQNLNMHNLNCYEEMKLWHKEIKKFRAKHLAWMFDKKLKEEMKTLKDECEKLNSQIENYEFLIMQLSKDKYYSALELTGKFKQLLAELGFACKTSTRSESNFHEEVYESTCSDEELLKRVETMTKTIEKQQNKKYNQINEKYKNPSNIDSNEVYSRE